MSSGGLAVRTTGAVCALSSDALNDDRFPDERRESMGEFSHVGRVSGRILHG